MFWGQCYVLYHVAKAGAQSVIYHVAKAGAQSVTSYTSSLWSYLFSPLH